MANNPRLAEVSKATQFKPGQSGNPAGPKPGYKHINTHIQELLNDEDFQAWVPDLREGIKEFKGAPIKAIIKAQMIKALSGDAKAFDSLAKYGWAQKNETDITGDLKLEIVTRHAGSKQLEA